MGPVVLQIYELMPGVQFPCVATASQRTVSAMLRSVAQVLRIPRTEIAGVTFKVWTVEDVADGDHSRNDLMIHASSEPLFDDILRTTHRLASRAESPASTLPFGLGFGGQDDVTRSRKGKVDKTLDGDGDCGSDCPSLQLDVSYHFDCVGSSFFVFGFFL